MMLEMRGSKGLKVRIKGIRLGLFASLVCKVSLRFYILPKIRPGLPGLCILGRM